MLVSPFRPASKDIAASVAEITATFPAKTAIASGCCCFPSASVLNGSSTTNASSMRLVPQLVPPAIFLASIPVAYLIFSSAARLSWLALVVLNPAVGILVRRRAPLV